MFSELVVVPESWERDVSSIVFFTNLVLCAAHSYLVTNSFSSDFFRLQLTVDSTTSCKVDKVVSLVLGVCECGRTGTAGETAKF